jgi:hypothetical protein
MALVRGLTGGATPRRRDRALCAGFGGAMTVGRQISASEIGM